MHQSNRLPAQTYPSYPLPAGTLLRLLWAAAAGRPLPFRPEALAAAAKLSPPLDVRGIENLPNETPNGLLLTVNHYSRPGFQAWWIALAISAALTTEIHWIVTARWRFAGSPLRPWVEPLSRRLFPRLAQVYGFTAMPPMPPDPAETAARAAAVRRLLAFARRHPQAWIGLAPEGYDSSDGRLVLPPPGVGRLVHHLCQGGRLVAPVGLYEASGGLCLRFGPPYRLALPGGRSAAELDLAVRTQVIQQIACLLPAGLNKFSPAAAFTQ